MVYPSKIQTGWHLIAEITVPFLQNLEESRMVVSAFEAALQKAELQVLRLVEHDFEPKGFTAMALLSESHASLHTWPEHDLVAFDVFSCTSRDKPEICLHHFVKNLGGEVRELKIIPRHLNPWRNT